MKSFFDLVSTRGLIFVTYVRLLLHQHFLVIVLSEADMTFESSTISGLRSRPETNCKASWSLGDQ